MQAAAPLAASPTQAREPPGRTVLLQQCLDEIGALGQTHVDLLREICVEALMPAGVDPGAGGHLARCLRTEGEALLKGPEAQHILGTDARLGGAGWVRVTQGGYLSDAQLAQCEDLLMRMEPLRSSVLQRLLRLLLPSTAHPVHAAVVCWLLAPLLLGRRPEVRSGIGHGHGHAHARSCTCICGRVWSCTCQAMHMPGHAHAYVAGSWSCTCQVMHMHMWQGRGHAHAR